MIDWMTLDEAAKAMGVKYNTFHKWVSNGKGPRYYRLPGNDIRIKPADFYAWVETLAERPAA